MATLELSGITKRWPNGRLALDGIDLELADGEFLVLVGPSGCGKSTLLRIVAGLSPPSSGRVLIDGRDVTEWPPQRRDVAMVFQSYALYPHLDVRRNLAYGLRVRGVAPAERERRVRDCARLLGIEELLDARPQELSGGQRQRVALGRALVREPRLFLLDEPLSNLDARLRSEMRAELLRLRRDLRTATLYVTHDQEEAMTLGERVAVLHEGRILQCAPPLELYRRPADSFVAGFIGSPQINLWPAELLAAGDGSLRLHASGFEMTLPASWELPRRELLVGFRPHDVTVVARSDADGIAGVEAVEQHGASCLVHARMREDGPNLRVVLPAAEAPAPGDPLPVRVTAERLHLFDPASGRRLGVG